MTEARDCLYRAFEAAKTVESVRIRTRLLEDIGCDAACAGGVEMARMVVNDIDDAKGKAMVLAAIGLAQAARGDGEAARAALAEATTWNTRVKPNERRFVLHGILTGHLAAEQFVEAANIASLFESQFDRSSAWIEIAKSQIAAGRPDEARANLQRVPTTSADSTEASDMPRIPGAIWPLYVEMGDVEAALKLGRAMPKGNIERCSVLCAVGKHHGKTGNRGAASAILGEAIEAARKTRPFASGMSDETAREFGMARVVDAHLGGGDIGGATRILQRIPNGYWKANALNGVAAAQAKAGDRAGARATLEQAIEMVVRMPDEHNEYVKVDALASLAMRQGEIGEKAAASATMAKAAHLLEGTGVYDIAMSARAVAEAYVLLGDRSSAKRTLEESVRKVATISDTADRVSEANKIVTAQITFGFDAAALVTLREVVLPLIPLADSYSDSRADPAVLLARAGDLAGGYKIARQIREDENYYDIRRVAAHHVRAKGAEEVLALAEKETDAVARSSLYHGLALALLKASDIEAPTFWLMSTDQYPW